MKYLLLTLASLSAFSKDLVGSVNKLALDATNLGYAVAGIGIIYAAFFLMTGRNEGKEKLGLAILGSVMIALSQSIINFIRGVA